MRIAVINPNTSVAMTRGVVERLRLRLPGGIEVVGHTAASGPAVIATEAAFEAGGRSAVEVARSCLGDADALLLACFGDPGIAQMRAMTTIPVVGLAEASVRHASALGRPWAIVTAGIAWYELLRALVFRCGCAERFVDVVVIEGTGLDALRDPDGSRARLQAAVDRANRLGAEHIVLGGAALVGMAATLKSDAALLDCVDCAAMALARVPAFRSGPQA